ncbi:tetratricopeptide repeat protein [Sorangium sp. So ce1000]|uniref:tetratricopeptide repeat protein n=1 Tax=Sorangium sp. So ce1000 TaxID=3133325 RepID=UPI003F5F80FF
MLPVLTGFRAAFGSIVILAAVAQAPYQCASGVEPDHREYEDPSEALYALAERFKASGDRRAEVDTLRFLVERYPSSRFARMAQQDLEALGDAGAPGAPGGRAPGDGTR